MITEPVNLLNKNEISVETADASLLVTIINMEEHTVTAEIPLIGEVIDFEGYADVTFPSGSFGVAQSVTATLIPTPSAQYLFETDDTVPRLPYEIRLNSGNKPPARDIELSVRVPDSFMASDYVMYIFALMRDNSDAPGQHDRFFKLGSGLDETVNMIKTSLPRDAFSNLYGKNGTCEAVITVGLISY